MVTDVLHSAPAEAAVLHTLELVPSEMRCPAAQPEVVSPALLSRQTEVPVPPLIVPELINLVSVPCTPVRVELPLSTKLVLAWSVVKTPLFGVVDPMVPGEAQSSPWRKLTFRFGTSVVLAITKGAVPVETVLVS